MINDNQTDKNLSSQAQSTPTQSSPIEVITSPFVRFAKMEAAGGKIMVPRTEISPEYGFMAVFIDTEGNRIGLHSVPK